MLTVVDEADSYDLASLATVKAGLGITDGSEDATLPPLISAASATITKHCNRGSFVLETVREVQRLPATGMLMLQRYPIVAVVEISEDGTAVDPSDYEVDTFTGIVIRLRDDVAAHWTGKLSITYTAGFELADMPPDLVRALIMLVQHYRAAVTRNPLIRAEETTDIERIEYVTQTNDTLPGPVAALIEAERKPAGA